MAVKILIVDDTLVNRKVLQGILRKEPDVEFATAANGEQAIETARRLHPDLVLLDIMMPIKDGYQVCAELKADPRTADIPIVFLSALNSAADKIKGFEIGGADYITKPFDNGEVLARVRTQLRLRRLSESLLAANRQLLEEQQRLKADLRAAAEIQRALIPRPQLRVPGIRTAWVFEPCATVGGDIFNVRPLDDEHVSFYVLDVNGHGVPAAMVSVSASQSLAPGSGLVVQRHAGGRPTITAPVDVLAELDREYPIGRFDHYFTISYLVLHLPTGLLRYSTAAHPLPVLMGPGGALRLLEEGGPVIGLGDMIFDAGQVALAVGDRVFLYTDGIVEHSEPDGPQFGTEALYAALRRTREQPLEDACEAIRAEVHAFAAAAPADDISLLAFEYVGLP